MISSKLHGYIQTYMYVRENYTTFMKTTPIYKDTPTLVQTTPTYNLPFHGIFQRRSSRVSSLHDILLTRIMHEQPTYDYIYMYIHVTITSCIHLLYSNTSFPWVHSLYHNTYIQYIQKSIHVIMTLGIRIWYKTIYWQGDYFGKW